MPSNMVMQYRNRTYTGPRDYWKNMVFQKNYYNSKHHFQIQVLFLPMGQVRCSLSSIPSEQLQPLSALFYCKYSSLQFWSAVPRVWLCKALYLGSVKRWHWCSSEKDPPGLGTSKYKYYVLHLSKEPFPKTVSDWEVVKTDCFSLMYPDFNVWKKVGNSYSTVSSCTQQ